jgi:hypothetical protein
MAAGMRFCPVKVGIRTTLARDGSGPGVLRRVRNVPIDGAFACIGALPVAG